MSEAISRRVFLKASGLAILSAAAAGVLAGCGGGGGTTIATPSAPTMSNDTAKPMGSFDVNMSAMTPWSYDGSSYLYAILKITENNGSFSIKTSDFSCTVGGTGVSVYSLGHVAASGAPFTSCDVSSNTASIPLYIKVPAALCTTDVPIQIIFRHDTNRMTFDFQPGNSYPTLIPG